VELRLGFLERNTSIRDVSGRQNQAKPHVACFCVCRFLKNDSYKMCANPRPLRSHKKIQKMAQDTVVSRILIAMIILPLHAVFIRPQ
jgi:hypothetical protein